MPKTRFGEPIKVEVQLTNPKNTIMMGTRMFSASDDNGVNIGEASVALIGTRVRFTVEGENYDLDCLQVWNAIVTQIGKPEYQYNKG